MAQSITDVNKNYFRDNIYYTYIMAAGSGYQTGENYVNNYVQY